MTLVFTSWHMKFPSDMNIILIGMPGSGKSTVGVILAKSLGVDFIDTDLLIQHREKRLLQDIIDKDGIEYFLDRECDAVLNTSCDNAVIATGGSVIFREEAMLHLKKNGTVIFLDVSVKELERRLSNIKTRGVAAEKGETVEDIYNKRFSLYKKFADISIDADSLSCEQTVNIICEKLKK